MSELVTKVKVRCRGFYVAVVEPKENLQDELRYSICCALDKSDTANLNKVKQGINNAAKLGVEKGMWTKKALGSLAQPLRDGDAEDKGEEFDNHMFFNANSTRKPGVARLIPGTNTIVRIKPDTPGWEDIIYSGAYYNVVVNFYCTKAGGTNRVAAGLNNIVKIEDGERLDGAASIDQDFDEYKVVDDEPGMQTEESFDEETDITGNVLSEDPDDDIPF